MPQDRAHTAFCYSSHHFSQHTRGCPPPPTHIETDSVCVCVCVHMCKITFGISHVYVCGYVYIYCDMSASCWVARQGLRNKALLGSVR
jgi:hypothetical protein